MTGGSTFTKMKKYLIETGLVFSRRYFPANASYMTIYQCCNSQMVAAKRPCLCV